jgi:hypothetical protein
MLLSLSTPAPRQHTRLSIDDDDDDNFSTSERDRGSEEAITVDLHVHYNQNDSDRLPGVPEGSRSRGDTPRPGVPSGSGGLSSYSTSYLNELSENTSKTLDFMYGICVVHLLT